MLKIFKRMAENILLRRGYALRDLNATPRGYKQFLQFANSLGINPETVIDIGVGKGTPWLYENYPTKKFVLFEALRDFETEIDDICTNYDCDIHYTGLGSKNERKNIRIPSTGPTGSSFLERTEGYEEIRRSKGEDVSNNYKEIEIKTLDSITIPSGPYVIKIDVEGYEIEVIKGSENTLKNTLMIIVETSISGRHINESNLSTLSNFLSTKGFDIFDFVNFENDSSNKNLTYCDVVYINKELFNYESHSSPSALSENTRIGPRDKLTA